MYWRARTARRTDTAVGARRPDSGTAQGRSGGYFNLVGGQSLRDGVKSNRPRSWTVLTSGSFFFCCGTGETDKPLL